MSQFNKIEEIVEYTSKCRLKTSNRNIKIPAVQEFFKELDSISNITDLAKKARKLRRTIMDILIEKYPIEDQIYDIDNARLYYFYFDVDIEKIKCKVCNKSMSGYTRWGNKHKQICCRTKNRKAYAEARKKSLILNCLMCGKEIQTNEHKKTKYCSIKCRAHYTYHHTEAGKIGIEKRKKTNIEKYGTEYVVNSEYTRKKTEEKLGVEYAWQSKEVLEKCKESTKEKYGVEHYMQSEEGKARMKATKLEKYGDYLPVLMKYKEFTFESGRTVKIQGYENHAINYFLHNDYSEDDIVTGRYEIVRRTNGKGFQYDDNGVMREYYPDLFIESENLLIEVKSSYTLNVHGDTVYKKQKCVVDEGFKHWIMVFDGRGVLLDIIK